MSISGFSLGSQLSLTSIGMTDKMSDLERGQDPLSQSTSFTQYSDDEETVINQMLSTVDSLTENINKIDEFIQQISSNHALIASQWANEEARKANEELHEKLKDLSHFVTDELKKMKRVLDRDQTGPDRNTADFRIRKAQYSTLSRRFRDVMLSYNQIEEEYRDKNKEKILRQIKIVHSSSNSEPEVSDEKLEELLDNDQLQAFTQSIVDSGSKIMQKRKILSEVEIRQMEIQRLEQNIRELHDMFYDLAQLVYDQGDLINQIEHNVEHTAVYVERGTHAATVASRVKKNNKKLYIIICSIVSCVAIVLLIVLILAIGLGVYFALQFTSISNNNG